MGTGDGEKYKDRMWSPTCKIIQSYIALIKFNT